MRWPRSRSGSHGSKRTLSVNNSLLYEDDEMTTQPADDALDRRAREIIAAVDAAWKAMADLDVEAKALALDRLTKRLAMEEASHDPWARKTT
jgi:hypothetical protein